MDKLRKAAAWLILGMWGVSYGESLINHHYSPPPGIDAVAMVVVGFLFASGFKRKNGDD